MGFEWLDGSSLNTIIDDNTRNMIIITNVILIFIGIVLIMSCMIAFAMGHIQIGIGLCVIIGFILLTCIMMRFVFRRYYGILLKKAFSLSKINQFLTVFEYRYLELFVYLINNINQTNACIQYLFHLITGIPLKSNIFQLVTPQTINMYNLYKSQSIKDCQNSYFKNKL
jgi:hypothetical protein